MSASLIARWPSARASMRSTTLGSASIPPRRSIPAPMSASRRSRREFTAAVAGCRPGDRPWCAGRRAVAPSSTRACRIPIRLIVPVGHDLLGRRGNAGKQGRRECGSQDMLTQDGTLHGVAPEKRRHARSAHPAAPSNALQPACDRLPQC